MLLGPRPALGCLYLLSVQSALSSARTTRLVASPELSVSTQRVANSRRPRLLRNPTLMISTFDVVKVMSLNYIHSFSKKLLRKEYSLSLLCSFTEKKMFGICNCTHIGRYIHYRSTKTFFSKSCCNVSDNNPMCVLLLLFPCWNDQKIRLRTNLRI